MGEFKFSCPQCSQKIRCDTGFAGTQITCPSCQQSIVVPPVPTVPAPAASSPAMRRGTPVLASAPPTVPPKSRTLQKVLVIAAAIVVLAGLAGGIWFGCSIIKMHFKLGHLPLGLVSLWSGEGNAIDSVGSNNGKLIGHVAYGSGHIGKAFVFDGSKDWVDVGNPPSLHLQDFTITVWMKRANSTSVTDTQHHICMLFCYGPGGYGLDLNADGRPVLNKVGGRGTSPKKFITDTNWHHLAVTKSGSTVFFYIDGIEYPAPAYDQEFEFTKSASIGGKNQRGWENTFAGSIDEVAVYNRALSAAEIRAVYTAQK